MLTTENAMIDCYTSETFMYVKYSNRRLEQQVGVLGTWMSLTLNLKCSRGCYQLIKSWSRWDDLLKMHSGAYQTIKSSWTIGLDSVWSRKTSLRPTEVLDACNHSKRELALKGYLNLRDSVRLTDEQRAVFVDLNNLIGVKMHFSFDRQLRIFVLLWVSWLKSCHIAMCMDLPNQALCD